MKTHEQRSDNLDCDVKPALHSEIIPILINIILLLHYWITFAGILFSKLFHLYLKLRFVIVFKLILIENQDDIHFGNFTWSVFILVQPLKMAKFIVWLVGWFWR